ncbi:MAG: hypothetical protein IKH33_01415 [Bacteroidales bacterium]|nr:hypothetical protein [Bacteroidales bacterium]
MNHSVKIMGLCALMALVATSCQKNEEKLTNTFTAELNQPTCEDKTHIGTDDYLVWDAGDQIMVFDATWATQNFTATNGGTTHTTFTGNGVIDPSANYYAFYPVNMITGLSGSIVTITVPATQTYVEGSFATNTYPMAGTNGGSGTAFTFRGLFGVLAIPLTGNCTIGSVELTDAAFNLCGQTTVDLNEYDLSKSSFVAPKSENTSRTITLTCEGGLALTSTPKVIMFALRPLACTYGFTVTFKDLDGEIIATQTAAARYSNAIRPEYILLMPTVDITIP